MGRAKSHGVISDAQLAWLTDVLNEPTPDGTVLAFHHPPVHLPDHPMRRVVLQNIDDLAAACSEVVAILTGHLHLQLSALLMGIPVWVTPGVVTRIDLTSPPQLVRGGAAPLAVVGRAPEHVGGEPSWVRVARSRPALRPGSARRVSR